MYVSSKFLFRILICEEEHTSPKKKQKEIFSDRKTFLCSFALKLEERQKKIVKINLTGRIRTIDLGIPIDRLLQSPALPTELR